MATVPSLDSAKKWYSTFKQFFPLLQDYAKDDNISARFSQILSDITAQKNPVIIADQISSILQEKIVQVQKGMKNNQDEFYNLMIELVGSIQNQFDMSIHVWKDRVIYFRDVEKVWISCEPMLDLIDNEEGSFDLLGRQLKHVKEIVYFVSNKAYYDDLIGILQSRQMDFSKLKCVLIPEKYMFPIVIYHSQKYRHGMRGKTHPNIKKDEKGRYHFASKLGIDWMCYLIRDFINKHYDDLSKYIQNA